MTESTARLRQEITELHERISGVLRIVRTMQERLQLDPGGSDRLDAIDDALQQLAARVAALEAKR